MPQLSQYLCTNVGNVSLQVLLPLSVSLCLYNTLLLSFLQYGQGCTSKVLTRGGGAHNRILDTMPIRGLQTSALSSKFSFRKSRKFANIESDRKLRIIFQTTGDSCRG